MRFGEKVMRVHGRVRLAGPLLIALVLAGCGIGGAQITIR